MFLQKFWLFLVDEKEESKHARWPPSWFFPDGRMGRQKDKDKFAKMTGREGTGDMKTPYWGLNIRNQREVVKEDGV